MRAPQHERQSLLGEAIHRATEELQEPIDRVEVLDKYVRCWAGSKMVTMLYHCSQPGYLDEHGDFRPYVGGGSWSVQVVPNPTPKRPTLIGRVLARLTK